MTRRPAFLVIAVLLVQCPRAFAQQCPEPEREPPGAAMGVGLVRPVVEAGRALYLYGAPEDDEAVRPDAPVDSIAFVATSYGPAIGYAPPWFFPEVVKLDYNLFYLRARTLQRHWVEVVVNKSDGRTAWMLAEDADFVSWPEFIVNAFSVERTAADHNPLRARPFEYADPLTDQGDDAPGEGFLEPLAVKERWLRVRRHAHLGSAPDDKAVTGWIIWREADRLCITYSLLS